MSCGIYKITNLVNGHSYIGQSKNIELRWSKEKARAFNDNNQEYNKTLSKAFRKYGLESFTFEILEECNIKELNEKEIYYINLYDTYFNGYNETTGGDSGNSNNCIKISKEDLLKIYDLLLNSEIPQNKIADMFSVGQDVISTINNGKSCRLEGYEYPLRQQKRREIKFCCDCNVQLKDYNSVRCPKCDKIHQRKVKDRPDRDLLKTLIRTKSFTEIGRLYGVTDNTIRKWCKGVNLPTKKSEISILTDDEWNLV